MWEMYLVLNAMVSFHVNYGTLANSTTDCKFNLLVLVVDPFLYIGT